MSSISDAIPPPTSSESDTPKITLHWLEKSRAQRILWLLEEINVPYEIKTYKRDPKTGLAAGTELNALHPLGKSPVITIGDRNIAESAFIVEYLSEHFGPSLIPSKWKDGCEGKVLGETEEYMRYRYYMNYCEGSLMTLLIVSLIALSSYSLCILPYTDHRDRYRHQRRARSLLYSPRHVADSEANSRGIPGS